MIDSLIKAKERKKENYFLIHHPQYLIGQVPEVTPRADNQKRVPP